MSKHDMEEMVNDVSGRIAGELKVLGESPEAWKGAVAVCEIMRAILDVATDGLEAEGYSQEVQASGFMFLSGMLTGCFKGVYEHPCAQAMLKAEMAKASDG